MQVETQVTRSLAPRHRGTLRRRLADEDFGAYGQGDGRVGVAGVGVGECAAAGEGVEGVFYCIAGLGDGGRDGWASVGGTGGR